MISTIKLPEQVTHPRRGHHFRSRWSALQSGKTADISVHNCLFCEGISPFDLYTPEGRLTVLGTVCCAWTDSFKANTSPPSSMKVQHCQVQLGDKNHKIIKS